jgi:diaminopimelate decarboxylase/aspartate kinase
LSTRWVDARELLRAEARSAASERAEYLSATCDFRPSATVQSQLAALGPLVITQGFIASDARGDTVLLGRGGSDTSAAYFAALLEARQLEIWTDVPGMFSANPRSTPSARQLLELTYDEAQEIATAGAKVLHPRCLLPVRQYSIPLFVFATQSPLMQGTRISAAPVNEHAAVKAVCVKKGITLVTLDSPGMWHQVGFLADAFAIFKQHGLSIDLVSTSETNVTVSLDPQANAFDGTVLERLLADLSPLCGARVIGPCASVSLVGRNIRAILHQLGHALELFAEQRIYLVSQAANDLNLTFVVDEDQGDRLVEELHDLLIGSVRTGDVLGPTWEQLFAPTRVVSAQQLPWWQQKREQLLEIAQAQDALYVYDSATVLERCRQLRSLTAVSRVLYAMKANPHPELLRLAHQAGLSIECVSRGEIERARATLPKLAPASILFTPNFAAREEYVWALAQQVNVTLDNLHPLEQWPEVFAGKEIFLRIDPGSGRGHHVHVRTGGTRSKFGIALEQIERCAAAVARSGARVIGLHAHTGSGILEIGNWVETAEVLAGLVNLFPTVRVLDIGGGLGIADRSGGNGLDLLALDTALTAFRARFPALELWIEPGRFVVAEAGVLLARVTQLKTKGSNGYVGIATGMNSLIRPALYGAHHEIVNLSRIDEPSGHPVDVVGPICESGDVLGHDRPLPDSTAEGDVLLIATAGAYGASMASHYNLREPAAECVI